MTRLIGYARVSTTDQEAGLDAQIRDLSNAIHRADGYIHVERASAAGGARPYLEQALSELERGDTLVVTKLDRLARNVHHLCEIVERIKAKGASLRILAMGLDTGTPTGTLMLNVLGSVAQFEREIMLERQREGIAKAKAAGKYKGSKPKVDPADVKTHYRLCVANKHIMPVTACAEFFGLSQRHIQRIVRGV